MSSFLRFILFAVGCYAISWVLFPPYSLRCKVTIEVKVDGKIKRASSVMYVSYSNDIWKSIPSIAPHRLHTYTFHAIAPIVDLGEYGSLVAALTSLNNYAKTGQPISGKTSGVLEADLLPLAAYNLEPSQIHLAKGRVQLNPKSYPRFIWIPPEVTDLRGAKPLLAEEFPEHISPNVVLHRVLVETTEEKVIETIAPPPPWIVNLQNAQPAGESIYTSDYTRMPMRVNYFHTKRF